MSREIEARPLDAAAFAPYGEVLAMAGAPSFAFNGGMADRWHALSSTEVTGDGGQVAISLARARPYALPLSLNLVERHPLGSQAFMPLSDRPFLVIVAPDEGGQPGRPVAFLTDGRQGVNYARGVWHGVLTPLGAEQEFLIVDRAGPGENLEEHWFGAPWTILAPRTEQARP